MNNKHWLFLPITLVLFFFGELNRGVIHFVIDQDILIELLDSDTRDQSSDVDDGDKSFINHINLLQLLPSANLYNDVALLFFESKNHSSISIRAPPLTP